MPSNPNSPNQDDPTRADSQSSREKPGTGGANPGQPPEEPEDRPNVGSVKPEDYPEEDRAR